MRASVRAVLQRLEPAPAVLLNRLGDVSPAPTASTACCGRSGCWTANGERPDVPRAAGVVELDHPSRGRLRLPYETLGRPEEDDQRLVVLLL